MAGAEQHARRVTSHGVAHHPHGVTGDAPGEPGHGALHDVEVVEDARHVLRARPPEEGRFGVVGATKRQRLRVEVRRLDDDEAPRRVVVGEGTVAVQGRQEVRGTVTVGEQHDGQPVSAGGRRNPAREDAGATGNAQHDGMEGEDLGEVARAGAGRGHGASSFRRGLGQDYASQRRSDWRNRTSPKNDRPLGGGGATRLERALLARDTLSMLATIPEPVRTLASAGFIEPARALAPIDGRPRHDWLPDGRTSLIFRLLDGGRRGDVCVAGPRTRARFKDLRGVTRALVLGLAPGRTMPLFGVAASELTDRIVPLTDLWGAEGRDLFERFAATADVPDLVDRATEALARRGGRSREPLAASLARRAARLLDAGELRVEDVAAGLGVSARHLR